MLPSFAWLLPGVVAGGPHPDRLGGLQALLGYLRRARIGAILSVFEEPLDTGELERLRIRYLWQPTPNFTPPPDLGAACAFIDQAREAGAATLVHCWMGWGRTGTVLAAYLLHRGLCETALEAVTRVREDYNPNAVESPSQMAALRHFAERAAT
ncbi:MAG TPA: dual specificity protein phosphatase family protein [Polyangia bacterium]|nr:dual specificity protein phosphatase family protein [Polyangia bacterium]